MSKNAPSLDRPLILGSTSPYRAALLERLGVPFEQRAPEVDETRQPDEPAQDYVARLAREKAIACTRGEASALIIAADQVCLNGDAMLGKPGDTQTARKQLSQASGRRVTFLTGVAVADSEGQSVDSIVVSDDVVFRDLEEAEIQRYVDTDAPLDCAGAFRAEGLGISLFDAVYSRDPTSLVGLPLISVARLLRERGVQLP